MRSILFFDLPTLTAKQRKSYRVFVRDIKSLGFVMMQESVYSKMSVTEQAAESTIKNVKKLVPKEGSIFVLTITEKQFSSMDFLLGDFKTDVIESDDKLVIL